MNNNNKIKIILFDLKKLSLDGNPYLDNWKI